MKIGVDIRVLMDKYYSGVSEYAASLLKAILEIDKTNDYKLFYNSWHDQRNRLGKWNNNNAQTFFSSYPNKVFNYCLQKIFHYPKIDKFIGGTDIFWSPHFNFTNLSQKTKKIITVHDLSFLRYPEFFSVRKNFWHQALGVKKTLLEADKIIAVSENTKNDIVELLGISESKIVVIYSGNNAARGVVDEIAVQEFLLKNNLSGRLLLYLGTIEPRKNIVNLMKAYEKLRASDESLADVKLVLAGANGWKNRQIYRQWHKSIYKNDIYFLGYINQTEKDILYSQATLFVYPSLYEGFGFPPLEAMTYGLPVVCSNVSSLPEVVGEAALMINPFEIKEISEAIMIILQDNNLRDLLIAKGLKRAEEFTWEKTAQEYLEVFKKLTC